MELRFELGNKPVEPGFELAVVREWLRQRVQPLLRSFHAQKLANGEFQTTSDLEQRIHQLLCFATFAVTLDQSRGQLADGEVETWGLPLECTPKGGAFVISWKQDSSLLQEARLLLSDLFLLREENFTWTIALRQIQQA